MDSIGGIFMGAGNLIFACVAVYNLWTARKRAEAISLLEKNTNSIKDALLKVTAESEHAKGVIQGKTEGK